MTDALEPKKRRRTKTSSSSRRSLIEHRNNATSCPDDRSREFGGSASTDWNNWMIDQALVTTPQYMLQDGTAIDTLNISLARIRGIFP
jgi:hypothetical protein